MKTLLDFFATDSISKIAPAPTSASASASASTSIEDVDRTGKDSVDRNILSCSSPDKDQDQLSRGIESSSSSVGADTFSSSASPLSASTPLSSPSTPQSPDDDDDGGSDSDSDSGSSDQDQRTCTPESFSSQSTRDSVSTPPSRRSTSSSPSSLSPSSQSGHNSSSSSISHQTPSSSSSCTSPDDPPSHSTPDTTCTEETNQHKGTPNSNTCNKNQREKKQQKKSCWEQIMETTQRKKSAMVSTSSSSIRSPIAKLNPSSMCTFVTPDDVEADVEDADDIPVVKDQQESSPQNQILSNNHRRQYHTSAQKSISTNTTQMYLDFGQASFGARSICKVCNMLVVHGMKEDEEHHRRICSDYAHGIVFGLKNVRRMSSTTTATTSSTATTSASNSDDNNNDEEGYIAEIRPGDPLPWRRKVAQARRIVNEELGFVSTAAQAHVTVDRDGSSDHHRNISDGGMTVFLYVIGKRVVGFCSVKIIDTAYQLIANDDGDNHDSGHEHQRENHGYNRNDDYNFKSSKSKNREKNDVNSTERISPTSSSSSKKRKRPGQEIQFDRLSQETKHESSSNRSEAQNYVRSTTPCKAMMGVHQLWCHRRHRKKSIATKLVDAARLKLIYGMSVPHHLIAFSSPTSDGAAFARRYTEVENPLVYDCQW